MKLNALFIIFMSFCVAQPGLAQAGKNREIDWAQELQLSAQQRQQILQVEETYRQELKALGATRCYSEAALQVQQQKLQQAMTKDLQTILSAEQTKQAEVILNRHHASLQARVAQEIAYKLEMSDEQRHDFFAALEHNSVAFTWPMDMQQHERDQAHFFAALEAHLNEQQKLKWQEEKGQQWQRFDELKPGCLLH